MPLPQKQGVITSLELCPDSESCNQVSRDDTCGLPVLQCIQSWLWERMPRLLEFQAGDDPLRVIGIGSI